MSIFLIAGMILTVILLTKQKDWSSVGFLTNFSYKLKGSRLSQNFWLAGAALFAANTALFGIAFVIMFFLPMGTILGILLCIPLSIFTWLFISEIWDGKEKDKIKMACVGNSFFLILMIWAIWHYIILQPAYPGDDLFMAWIGLIFSLILGVGAMTVSMFVILRNR
ncbi:hypothetical protein ACFW35_17050 [Fictibacillus sp. NPDC058756]|uniref:hypothetical protein n=1 Tax=Fictibacillus sp. NPDC058756 TaxID=3346625 RepID=UPI00368AA2FF